ncbi:hypothetical protein PsYK624_012040 [Phanerochaete sordida]|uniref:Uncharacterized protein n=1 Tax=Phanerochaete sordida TaxID=48140 RepID=A0A9P3FYX9_9APHY|nr:hypothetical protein PsYK624_012040 [Phanerochaete sordida]
MRPSEPSPANKFLQNVQGRPPTRTHSISDLMAIDSSVLRDSKVHFGRPCKTTTIGTTYSREEYDRTSIQVERRTQFALEMPERGRRMYRDGREISPNDSPAESPMEAPDADYLTRRLEHISVRDDGQDIDAAAGSFAYAGGPSSPPPARASNPVASLMDDESDDDDSGRAMAFFMRRPGTPLPPLCLRTDDSDEDDSPVGSVILGGPGDPLSPLADISGSDSDGSPGLSPVIETGKRSAYFPTPRTVAGAATILMTDRTPSLTSDGTSSSDESEGPMSPRTGFAPAIPLPKATKGDLSWKLGMTDTDGCLDGF